MAFPQPFPSRTNPRPRKSTSKRGFLALPGEVRNKIYTYYFQTSIRCEICSSPPPTRKTMKLSTGIAVRQRSITTFNRNEDAKNAHEEDLTIRVPRKMGNYKLAHSKATRWASSVSGLPFVCRLVYGETLPFLYARTRFVFDAPKRLTGFLSIVSQPNLQYITKLELHYVTYGDPREFKDRVWSKRHLESWVRACRGAVRAFCGLRVLRVWVRVNSRPLQLSLREEWVQPLLQFRRLSRPSKQIKAADSPHSPSLAREPTLQIVEVHLKTYLTHCTFDDNSALAQANVALTKAFAYAIGQMILGKSEKKAMKKFNHAWEGKYKMWQHHLQYAEPSWGRISDTPSETG